MPAPTMQTCGFWLRAFGVSILSGEEKHVQQKNNDGGNAGTSEFPKLSTGTMTLLKTMAHVPNMKAHPD
jgi:hypothetical protein